MPDAIDRHAREVLRNGSRSFDAAARLLPRSVRAPATALYAYCREADDAIDQGTGTLQSLRMRLDLIYAGRPLRFAADEGFAEVVAQFGIPRGIPEALLEGFAWDAESRQYRTLSDVRAYAVRVAGTVGVMMALLMGIRDRARLSAAVELGVAMQLSNIARDVGEDARNGRLYLPLDWLNDVGIGGDAFLARPVHSAALAGVVRRLLAAADRHYEQASIGIAGLPLSCRFGIGAARLLYAEIGAEVARRGHDSVSGRAVVTGGQKLRVLATGLPLLLAPAGLNRKPALAGNAMPEDPWTSAAVPEAVFLLQAIPPARPSVPHPPWWALPDRMVRTIDLFDRIARRECQQAQP